MPTRYGAGLKSNSAVPGGEELFGQLGGALGGLPRGSFEWHIGDPAGFCCCETSGAMVHVALYAVLPCT